MCGACLGTPEDADAASVNGQDLRADPSLRHLLCTCDVMSLPYCTMTTHLCPHPATRSQEKRDQGRMPICQNARMGWEEMGCRCAQGRLGGKGFSNLPTCAGCPSGTCAYLCRCCVYQCQKNVNSCGDGIDPILVLIMSHSHMLFCSSCPTASQRGKKIFTNGFEEGNGIGQGECECQARCVSRNACSRSLESLLYLMGGR